MIYRSRRFPSLHKIIALYNASFQGEKAKTQTTKALDCGAGIGRITKLLLTTVFDSVDLVEQNPNFVQHAPAYLGEDKARKVEKFICSGLQSFTPEPGRYDVIWIQWVLGHLTDEDFIAFFKRCKAGLRPNGIICVKENISFGDEPEFDEKDSSYTRPRETLMQLFAKTGLNLLKEEKQKHFPKELYEVRMFAFQ